MKAGQVWTAPEFEEIGLNCEINSYVSSDR